MTRFLAPGLIAPGHQPGGRARHPRARLLERLFDEPAAGRTPAAAHGLVLPQWERLTAEEPELTTLFADEEQRGVWLDEANSMLARYFTLEDPTRLEPAHREMAVQTVLESGLTLRG